MRTKALAAALALCATTMTTSTMAGHSAGLGGYSGFGTGHRGSDGVRSGHGRGFYDKGFGYGRSFHGARFGYSYSSYGLGLGGCLIPTPAGWIWAC